MYFIGSLPSGAAWHHTCGISASFTMTQAEVSYNTCGGNVLSKYIAPLCKNRILQALNQTSCIHSFFFFIITISGALHGQINRRHTVGMSTCPHCNEVQPCNLYIKCTLCPFIAWRELKASWCFSLRRSLVFWWGGGFRTVCSYP